VGPGRYGAGFSHLMIVEWWQIACDDGVTHPLAADVPVVIAADLSSVADASFAAVAFVVDTAETVENDVDS